MSSIITQNQAIMWNVSSIAFSMLFILLLPFSAIAQEDNMHYAKEQMAKMRRVNAAEAQKAAKSEKSATAAGLQLNKNYTAEELIKDIFIGGGCFDVTNIEFTGNTDAKGVFSSGESSVGIAGGIILSTGDIDNALGPNNANSTSTGHGLLTPDVDLLNSVDNSTNKIWDQVVLEFDFTPTTDMVSFEYVFASEEYCEFAGQEYNDVFGFFISGPGIDGPFSNKAENIALIPGTDDFVSINSVNHFRNNNYYIKNERSNGAYSCGTNYNPHAINDIEYDGFTTLLTATTSVIPCQTYHIRLTLGDGEDDIYDSAVFLKANSFDAGGTALASAVSEATASNMVYETCNDGYFLFERTSDNLEEDMIINFVLSPESTAEEGVDYANLPTFVTIPAGEMFATLPIVVFPDNLPENEETLIIEIDNACSCTSATTEMVIREAPPLAIVEAMHTNCEGESAFLEPNISGGVTPYQSYTWSNGSNAASLDVTPSDNEVYTLTVTDNCGQSIVGNYLVEVVPMPEASISGTRIICDQEEMAAFEINMAGSGPWNIEYTIDGVSQAPITSIENTYLLETNTPGNYELVSVQDAGCPGAVSGVAELLLSDMEIAIETEAASCYNNGLGSINLTTTNGIAPYSYDWNASLGETEDLVALSSGSYEVTISDQYNCKKSVLVTVENEVAYPTIAIETPGEINCIQSTVQLQGSNMNDGLTHIIEWSTPDGHILSGVSSLEPIVDANGTYHLTVTNPENGCSTSDLAMVNENMVLPQSAAVVEGELTCSKTSLNLAIETAGATDISYAWTTAEGNIVDGATTDAPLVDAIGIYYLETTNLENGCTSTSATTVSENIEPPLIQMTEGAELTCSMRELTIGAVVMNSEDYHFTWRSENGNIVEGEESMTPKVDEAGMYAIVVTNTYNGCTASNEVEITENTDYPELMLLEQEDPKCVGEMGVIAINDVNGGVEPYMYSTNGGESFYSQNYFDELTPGEHHLMVQDINGCELDTMVYIREGNNPDIELKPVIELSLGDEHTINASLNVHPNSLDSISWYPAVGLDCTDCLEPTILPTHSNLYTVTVIDENGCQDIAEIQLRVSFDGSVYVPNAFSPHNRDGSNDLFEIYPKENILKEIRQFRVLDRWGNQLYHNGNIEPTARNYGWDGTFRGKPMMAGVYVYHAELELIDGSIINLSGDVTLMN